MASESPSSHDQTVFEPSPVPALPVLLSPGIRARLSALAAGHGAARRRPRGPVQYRRQLPDLIRRGALERLAQVMRRYGLDALPYREAAGRLADEIAAMPSPAETVPKLERLAAS
jgi:hypothetical protein